MKSTGSSVPAGSGYFQIITQPMDLRADYDETPEARSFLSLDVRAIQLSVKRSIDVVFATLGIVLLSPLMFAIMIAIRLESKGPSLFRQQRLGLRGKPFHVLKFRTMVSDAEAKLKDLEHLNESVGGVLFKIKEDPRVTRLGRFLRRSSLDELPQLFNILAGQMSLVGPRPLQNRDCDLLREYEPMAFTRRLEVVPGLTGHWQISGRSNTTIEHMLDLDIQYIERWSLWFDLQILIRTPIVVLSKNGAY